MKDTSNQIELCKVKTYAKISELKLHPNNPRKISSERLAQLKDSIIKKGFYEPILVWKKGAVVLSGNHRLQAVRELVAEGYEFNSHDGMQGVLPVIIEDVDYKTAEAILFEANNHYAEWIENKLKEAIQEAVEHGSDATDFGFTDAELKKFLRDVEKEAEEVLRRTDVVDAHRITEDDIEKELGPSFTQPEKVNPVTSTDFEVIEEEFGYLTLPKPSIEKLRKHLEIVAKAIDENWNGTSLSDAAEVYLEVIEKSGVLEEIKGNSDGEESS
jgi:ParB-like chromosome segregation protein Spo0J